MYYASSKITWNYLLFLSFVAVEKLFVLNLLKLGNIDQCVQIRQMLVFGANLIFV